MRVKKSSRDDAHGIAHPAPFPLALLADANGDVRDLYAAALDSMVGRFAYAEDGREALVKALANPPSVLITDGRLPFIDGYELCELLRRDAATRAMPIVMVTDPILPADIRRAEMAGANAVLVKPCLPESLQAALQRLAPSTQLPEHSRAMREWTPEQRANTHTNIDRSRTYRRARTYTHQRGATTTPPLTPPAIICPLCDRPLRYLRSQLGGVTATNPEQWDYLQCELGCGAFQYRHRTRKLQLI